TSEYEDLVKIITHPEFRKEDVLMNIRQVRKWRNRLPLVEIRQHNVPLHMDKAPSTFRDVIVDETDKDSLKLKVDIIFLHENLSSIHSTDNRHIRGNGKELWLNEGETNLVNPTNVERRINVWLCDMSEPSEYEFYIKEIVYRFNGKWKYCDIKMQHRLPCENITLMPSPPHLPILK
ncbi:1848_t:CDS:2, partial [Cetraspora pellucida]